MENNAAGNRVNRRTFLQNAGMMGLAPGLLQAVVAAQETDLRGADLQTASGKPLRGLYPILETPFTQDDKLDMQALAAEVAFINRGRVNGMIWLVFASSWSTMSDAERIEGAETILAAGKGARAAIVIAVQNPAWDTATSVRYAERAAAHGADGIESMPPNNGWNVSDEAILDYYKAIGAATDLPVDCADPRNHERRSDGQDVQRDSNHEGHRGRSWQSARTRCRTDAAHR
jgi:hypothetical protein